MTRWGIGLCAGVAISVGGCVATTAVKKPKPALYLGDPDGAPELAGLPSADVADEELTPEMRVARLLCAESLSVPDPPMPTQRDARSMQAWSETTFMAWVQDKSRRARAAKEELDKAAAQNHRQRIMAGALVGLLYEDLAEVILEVPVPDDLLSEPEVAKMFREVMDGQALPYITQARLAYDACSGNAIQTESMKHWSDYCRVRSKRVERMGQADDAAAQGAGETEVVVVAP